MGKTRTCENIAEVLDDVYRITLPLPGVRPGPVNVYLFRGVENVIIDTGTRRTARLLERSLAFLGVAPKGLARIVLTHGHLEHYGAARYLVRRSRGAISVEAHREDRRFVERGLEVPRMRYLEYYRMMGVPLAHRLSLGALQSVFSLYADTCRVDRELSDGDSISLGDRRGTVISTPGHTRGSVCIFLEKEKALFSGDHILGHITPNAFVMLEEEHGLPRRLSQEEYFASLQRAEDLGASIAFPAHGRAVENITATIEMYRAQYLRRSETILGILGEGEITAYATARRLFPALRGPRLPLELFLAISEVFTHLQVLIRDGFAVYRNKGGMLFFGMKS